MKAVNVSFMSNAKILFASMNLPEKSTIGKLKEGLKNKIDVFHYGDIIIIEQQANGNFDVLEDTKTIGSISAKGEINLKAMPRFVLCGFKQCETYSQKQIDVLKPVFHIMFDVLNDIPLVYLMGYQYQREGKKNIVYKMLSYSLPLCVQGWFHDTLFIVQKIPPIDIWNYPETTIANYLENFRLANKMSISAYSLDAWGKIAAFQFLSEKIPQITETYVRQNISRCVPVEVKNSSESELIERTIFHIRKNKVTDPKTAKQYYFNTIISDGCQAGFMEKVKFKVVGGLFYQRRYIYISQQRVYITKDLSTNIVDEELTTYLRKTYYDGENLIVEFDSKVKWAMKTKRAKIIKTAIDDIITCKFADFVIPESKSTEFDIKINDPSKTDQLPNNEEEIAVVAPIHKLAENEFDSISSTEESLFKMSNPGLTISPSLQSIGADEESTKSGNKVRNLKIVPKCIPKFKIPDPETSNDSIDVKLKSMNVISIVQPVEENINLSEEEKVLPSAEDFFQYTGYEEFTNNKALLLWLLFFSFIISVTRFLSGSSKK
ncbi:hypothetical protein TVAG_486180 [Trichomonas vaginalis G3]|uniref:Uncharacterized protein n=1 Tax=Trichomonas vaginalis (strain ATCC PRA-98 / G3) TaxID=412133 RepID=A2EEG5_TRIV3|nr:hypothetical protein TVAGG3_0691230 [Trichomonas vaginalis G3]EAY08971.1 hypothetical protein TVAG_486180 [Trichomonas vaginalis G3]KAI5508581.1 hypothetical protein TVAGG3_0691230 [Trichomonas vaginalis G3]|eukprot:XP_001321194.1 hypothetical protein [Trichomonas vaginalis G3]